MGLNKGDRLGPYEIQAPLGAGGRGPALELADRSPAKANAYENAPVTRFPRGSELASRLQGLEGWTIHGLTTHVRRPLD